MAREGLMDDAGYHGFDYEPPCEKCGHDVVIRENGELYASCDLEFCDFKERE